jgi:CheY-like chemotaxis protein
MMPELDGYETLRRIRQDPRYRALPIIAITAKALKEDREKCIHAGAFDYLPKPIEPDKLVDLIRFWTRRNAQAAPPLEVGT